MKTKEFMLILRETNNDRRGNPNEHRAVMKSCKLEFNGDKQKEHEMRKNVIDALCELLKITLEDFEKVEFTLIEKSQRRKNGKEKV